MKAILKNFSCCTLVLAITGTWTACSPVNEPSNGNDQAEQFLRASAIREQAQQSEILRTMRSQLAGLENQLDRLAAKLSQSNSLTSAKLEMDIRNLRALAATLRQELDVASKAAEGSGSRVQTALESAK